MRHLWLLERSEFERYCLQSGEASAIEQDRSVSEGDEQRTQKVIADLKVERLNVALVSRDFIRVAIDKVEPAPAVDARVAGNAVGARRFVGFSQVALAHAEQLLHHAGPFEG